MEYYVQVITVDDDDLVVTRTWYSDRETAGPIAEMLGEPDAEGLMTQAQMFTGAAASGATAYVRED